MGCDEVQGFYVSARAGRGVRELAEGPRRQGAVAAPPRARRLHQLARRACERVTARPHALRRTSLELGLTRVQCETPIADLAHGRVHCVVHAFVAPAARRGAACGLPVAVRLRGAHVVSGVAHAGVERLHVGRLREVQVPRLDGFRQRRVVGLRCVCSRDNEKSDNAATAARDEIHFWEVVIEASSCWGERRDASSEIKLHASAAARATTRKNSTLPKAQH